MGNYIFYNKEDEPFTLLKIDEKTGEAVIHECDLNTAKSIVQQNGRFEDTTSLISDLQEVYQKEQQRKNVFSSIIEKQCLYLQKQTLQHEILWYKKRMLRKRSAKKIQQWWRKINPELRVCVEDGLAYSYEEFMEYYGNDDEWKRSNVYSVAVEEEKIKLEKKKRRRNKKKEKKRKKKAAKRIQAWYKEQFDERRRYVKNIQENFCNVTKEDISLAMDKVKALNLMEQYKAKLE